MGFIDGLLSVQQSTFVFHTRQQIPLPPACLSTFQEKMCSLVEMTNTMHLFVPLLYSIYWFVHVSEVACHHQGAP
jgi:hypothetical protein